MEKWIMKQPTLATAKYGEAGSLSAFCLLIVVSSSLIGILALLPVSVLNVALPYMQAELGATPDEISWSVTSYLIATAVFMPLSGILADMIGAKRLVMLSCF